jgi:branched-chain amino acid transport system ATP-binding protein
MLSVAGLEAGYGPAQVLFGVDLEVGKREVVALMGRNGMGKTTTVRAIMGLLRPLRGEVMFRGERLTGAPAHRVARAGIGLVPEGRQVFPTLSVQENLIATAASRHGPPRWTLDRVYDLFPRLAERRGNRGSELSGGEQQMLAVGRALMTNPALLILDEASEGLAPLIRAEIFACLAALRAEGESILVIDKHVAALARLADRVVMLEKGRVAWSGSAAALTADPALADRFLHV